MKFKKIYIELSDICGLKCDFCPSKKAIRGVMSQEKFDILAKQIHNQSKLFALHLLGDPLILSDLEDYLKIAKDYNMKLEITTSGFYFNSKNCDLLLKYENIHQINISLMAFLSQSKLSLEEYFKPIIEFCKEHLKNENSSFINLRLWNLDSCFQPPKENLIIYRFLSKEFQKNIDNTLVKNYLARHIILHQNTLFKWPNLSDTPLYFYGKCYALKDQIGILSDGTLVPCCLDTQGDINLGNIFENDFKSLLQSQRLQSIKKAFEKNKRIEKLCQSCEFFKARLDD
ncbi:radical SAM/SPASM domain-containing protein [Campylobacter estrildidarum]|uniref:Radical SAM protein n=1 Tax=Campylobacter estrildidarum TaxID=2510189 RepID=A0A4U7BLU5_9BACT|nr:radical SAM/SPASM domain-containing protein [Campylobacter estrildidarum]TKX31521.1 radical SAM protein [Campylobacter estrildidarum]